MVSLCTRAEGVQILPKARSMYGIHRFHLTMDDRSTDPDTFRSIEPDVVGLSFWYCKDSLITSRLPLYGLKNLVGYGVNLCELLMVSKSDFKTNTKLRFIEFSHVSFASIQRDTFTDLPDLGHLSLDFHSDQADLEATDHKASILRLHCDCDYLWLRSWIKRNPQIVAPKAAAQMYALNVPYGSPRYGWSIGRSQVFIPVDCRTRDVTEYLNRVDVMDLQSMSHVPIIFEM